jgi:hypothetical protein
MKMPMKMRRHISLIAAACLLHTAAAFAQAAAPAPVPATSPEPVEIANVAEFTVRGTSFDTGSDQARFMRYRDLRNGGTLDLLRFSKANDARLFTVQADHVGYRDQRFSASVNNFGRVKASFEFNSIPLFFNEDTKTLFTPQDGTPGTLRLADTVQTGLQNKTLPYASVDGLAQPFELRLKREVADF